MQRPRPDNSRYEGHPGCARVERLRYLAAEDVVALDEVEDEFVVDAAGVAAGVVAVGVVDAVAAASFFSPAPTPPVSPPVLEGGLSLSE